MKLWIGPGLPPLIKDSSRGKGRREPFALKLGNNGPKQNVPSVSALKIVGTECVPDHSEMECHAVPNYDVGKFSLTTTSQFEGNRWTRQKAAKPAKSRELPSSEW
jgi:hypothetical protein